MKVFSISIVTFVTTADNGILVVSSCLGKYIDLLQKFLFTGIILLV